MVVMDHVHFLTGMILQVHIPKFTHWSTNIAGWKMKLLKMYFLLKIYENGDIPASYVSLPEGI